MPFTHLLFLEVVKAYGKGDPLLTPEQRAEEITRRYKELLAVSVELLKREI